MRYVVTNVRLEATMMRSLKLRALERGVPVAILIREAIQQFLSAGSLSRTDWKRALDDFLQVCGSARSPGSGPGTGSTDLDDVLYGPARRRGRP